MLRNTHIWIEQYLKQHLIDRTNRPAPGKRCHVLFTICDHYEPYWQNTDHGVAYERVKKWVDRYPSVATAHADCRGSHPRHCFFYPSEEYRKEWLDMIGEICRNGFGETEIHLHHDNDTADNLRKTLLDFKGRLAGDHGLLPVDKTGSEIRYGFIHGDWALDNSSPDGKCCGVNNEISILQETGCYADFTMPSAPSDTQTRTINGIYYAVDDPEKPKSHDTGPPVVAGKTGQAGLLCIQGPLGLNMHSRKFGILPRIENGYLSADMPMAMNRIRLWMNQRIHVQGRSDILFVKLYTHGTQERIMDFFFEQGALDTLFTSLENFCDREGTHSLYYVSSRQMYNVVKGLESDPTASPADLLEYELELQY